MESGDAAADDAGEAAAGADTYVALLTYMRNKLGSGIWTRRVTGTDGAADLLAALRVRAPDRIMLQCVEDNNLWQCEIDKATIEKHKADLGLETDVRDFVQRFGAAFLHDELAVTRPVGGPQLTLTYSVGPGLFLVGSLPLVLVTAGIHPEVVDLMFTMPTVGDELEKLQDQLRRVQAERASAERLRMIAPSEAAVRRAEHLRQQGGARQSLSRVRAAPAAVAAVRKRAPGGLLNPTQRKQKRARGAKIGGDE